MLSTWEELEAESDRLREEEIRLAKFILADDAYEDLSAEVRAGLGRRFVLLQEMLKVVYEQKSDVEERYHRAKQEREAFEKSEAEKAKAKDSDKALDVFSQVRTLISLGAVHRSGLKMDDVQIAQIRENLSFEMVELHQAFEGPRVDLVNATEEACDLYGVLVHLLIRLGLSEQDVAERCAKKFAKRFRLPKKADVVAEDRS